MNVVNVQVALFFKDLVSRPDILAEKINQSLGNMFDSMPTCIELPFDSPIDIPIVYRKSSKLSHQLNVARSRCDIIFTPLIENNYLAVIESRYSNEIMTYIKAAMADNEIIRVGVVYNVFQENSKPCDIISNLYFNGLIKDVNELSFRMNKVTSVKGMKVNSVFSVSNAFTESNGHKSEGILYTRDINNIVRSSNTTLTYKEITNIIKYSFSMLDEKKFVEAR